MALGRRETESPEATTGRGVATSPGSQGSAHERGRRRTSFDHASRLDPAGADRAAEIEGAGPRHTGRVLNLERSNPLRPILDTTSVRLGDIVSSMKFAEG